METEKLGLILPDIMTHRLSVRETQEAIKYIRDTFQKEFGKGDESGENLCTVIRRKRQWSER